MDGDAAGGQLADIAESLGGVMEHLERSDDAREGLIRGTRDIVILCSQSIIAVHGGDLGTARSKAEKAAAMLESYRGMAPGRLAGHLSVPEQELVEAHCLLALAEGRRAPGRDALGVSAESYVLGLLDCIGELKRMTYDMIRRGRAGDAGRTFEIMEEMYSMLYPFAAYDKVVRDVRRKLDVNRAVLEGARAAVTEEARRSALIDAMGEGSERADHSTR